MKFRIIISLNSLYRISFRIILILYLSDERNGMEVIEKACGKPELSNFEYKEGCERIGIPYREKECYCRARLCNGANATSLWSFLALFTILWGFACFAASKSQLSMVIWILFNLLKLLLNHLINKSSKPLIQKTLEWIVNCILQHIIEYFSVRWFMMWVEMIIIRIIQWIWKYLYFLRKTTACVFRK